MYYENIWKRVTTTTEPDRTWQNLNRFDSVWLIPRRSALDPHHPTSINPYSNCAFDTHTADLASDFTPAGGSAVRRRISLDNAGYGMKPKPKPRRQSCSRICWLQQILICPISLDFHVWIQKHSPVRNSNSNSFQFIPLFPATVPCHCSLLLVFPELCQLCPMSSFPSCHHLGWPQCGALRWSLTQFPQPRWNPWNPVEHEIFTSGHRRKVLSLAKWWNGQKMRNENYGILWNILKIMDMIIYEFMNTMDYEILWIWMIWRWRKSMEKSSWTWMGAGTSNYRVEIHVPEWLCLCLSLPPHRVVIWVQGKSHDQLYHN